MSRPRHKLHQCKGYASTPPDKACEFIDDSSALLAIATRHDEVKQGIFMMPKAVDEEMSMAYAKKKPILLFAENGVDTTSGFIRNFATYVEFDRKSLLSPAFVEKTVSSIHDLKLNVISPSDEFHAQMGGAFFAEFIRSLDELVDNSGSYTWRYHITRKLRFTSRSHAPLRAYAWAVVPASATSTEKVKWSYKIEDGSKQFRFVPKFEKHTHEAIDLSLYIDPVPDKGDFIQYSEFYESPYLNPVYLEDLPNDHSNITIDGTDYASMDGFLLIARTKDLKIQFRFPASLGLMIKDFVPFVASHSRMVDYLVDSEMKRINVNRDSIGGEVIIEISVQSPLIYHMYGIAWNPPKKPKIM
jgi:hypothetical protein